MSNEKTTIKVNKETSQILKAKKCPETPTIEAVILNLIKENENLKQDKENLIKILKNSN